MSEIAKCPMCGKNATEMLFGAGWAQTGFSCCGFSAHTIKKWNQYAAAMELAKKLKELSQCDINTQYAHIEKQVEAAERRVLEVFR